MTDVTVVIKNGADRPTSPTSIGTIGSDVNENAVAADFDQDEIKDDATEFTPNSNRKLVLLSVAIVNFTLFIAFSLMAPFFPK